MTDAIVDTSAIMAMLLPDERGPLADLVLATLERHPLAAPPHWPLEIANAIRSAVRRKRLTNAEWPRIAAQADVIVASASVHPTATTTALLDLATHFDLTAYDAAYVDLAQRLGCPLLTNDQQMRTAATALAIPLMI